MTEPTCASCGRPSDLDNEQRCGVCAGYQRWAGSDTPRVHTDRHRDQRLAQARAALVTLPNLVDQLARCLTERGDNSAGGRRKVIGSPAPLRLDVLHLTDTRRKRGWEGEDPRERGLGDRYGVAATLESWTRVVCEEMAEPPELAEQATVRSEAAVLISVWDWITEQQWAEELADDVLSLAGQVKAALGIRPEYRPRCRYCGFRVDFIDEQGQVSVSVQRLAYGRCTGCERTFPKGPAMDALGRVQPPMTAREVIAATGIAMRTLRYYREQGLVKPVGKRGTADLYELEHVVGAMAKVRGKTA